MVRNRNFSLSVLALSALSAAGAANAAVPAGAEAVFTGLATDFGTIAGYGFTALAVITGGLVVFKLVKKVVGKAT